MSPQSDGKFMQMQTDTKHKQNINAKVFKETDTLHFYYCDYRKCFPHANEGLKWIPSLNGLSSSRETAAHTTSMLYPPSPLLGESQAFTSFSKATQSNKHTKMCAKQICGSK